MAVKSIVSPVKMIVIVLQLNMAIIIINSPKKLIVGGSARLIKLDSSHQVVINGNII